MYYALNVNEFNQIFIYNLAKKIWDRLKVTHKDTNQVKKIKINMLVYLKPNKTIIDMFTCFTDIINRLKSLGRAYSNSNLMRKILRSLPKSWEAKVTAI